MALPERYVARFVSGQSKDWHCTEVSDVIERLACDRDKGLSQSQVLELQQTVGFNRMPVAEKVPEWKKLLAQLKDPLVGLLLVAAVVATVVNLAGHGEGPLLQRMGDAIAILIIVVLNAVLGYLQERRAERALDALAKMTSPTALVIRDGEVDRIDAEELVPGDLVVLETGDRVSADLRLIEGADLTVDEALLTGESHPVEKVHDILLDEDVPVADRVNMAFMGCTVVRGRGRGVVAETGARTRLGRIGELIGGASDQQTPLEERLEHFGKGILWVTLIISALVFAVGLLTDQGTIPHLFLVAVALAVAVIPEGLPAISTITLALGMQRMAKHGALVRRLPAVETLGCATVICSDKTGTLTCNEMTVREVRLGKRVYRVEGNGYQPEGKFFFDGAEIEPLEDKRLQAALRCGARCTSSRLIQDEEEGWRVRGDPTEGALLTLAVKGGLEEVVEKDDGRRISEIPFAAERRMMAVVMDEGPGERFAYVKGSPDELLGRCETILGPDGVAPLNEENRQQIEADLENMAKRALRVLGLAHLRMDAAAGHEPPPERGLTWLGLVGMNDPPRPEVKRAIEECRVAQVRVVMVTGDHALTARSIAEELGMWDDGDKVVTGAELRQLGPDKLAEEISRVRVFARVTAEQKMDIVQAFQKRGEVVAVTGDGVNDAPALKHADVGVAMGRSGTDVAREASDMVLADDNFATIVAAVKEGRAIFRNIQKFIFFLCSSNAGLCVAVFLASILGYEHTPLTPLMILWINLVTNGLPALALGVDPPEKGQMVEGPRARAEGLLGPKLLAGMVAVGAVMGICSLILYERELTSGGGPLAAQLAAFMVLGLSPLFHAFNCRSFRTSVFSIGPFNNRVLIAAVVISGLVMLSTVLIPPLRPIFRTTAELGEVGWWLVVVLSFLPLPLVEIFKGFLRLSQRQRAV